MESRIDSIGAVDLRNELQSCFNTILPATLILDYPTISAISSFIHDGIKGKVPNISTMPRIGRAQHDILFCSLEDVEELVGSIVKSMTRLEISKAQPLMEAGIDAVVAVRLRNELARRFDLDMPSTVVQDYPSIMELGHLIFSEIEKRFEDTRITKSTRNLCEYGPEPESHHLLFHAKPLGTPPSLVVNVLSMNGYYPMCERYCSARQQGAQMMIEHDTCLPVPLSRWDAEADFNPLGGSSSKYVRVGIFLAGLELFDAVSFNISTQEAHGMYPQTRILLETAFSCLSNNLKNVV